MEKIIEYFAANPVHLAIALVLAFVVLFSFVKKLLKLGLVIVAIFIIYIAFLVYTGKEFDPDQFDEVGKKAKEMINESKESIENTIDKKKKEAVDRALGGT
jgi:predicted tellurium resistance membrane protein TerC